MPEPQPPTQKNVQGGQTDLQTAKQVDDALKGQSKTAAPAADAPKEYPKRGHVRTTSGGEMLHLFTNDVIDKDGKRIDLDHFAISQIEAGKWQLFDPNGD
jgi:hypothetical protein